jgi:undecaprenyl-diphosphatase
MSFFHAVILGIVEGITEFLPISSTAHLMMASKILRIADSEFLKSFEIVIQLGAVVAIMLVFGRHLVKNTWVWKKIVIAFIPTAIIGLALYKLIKAYLIGNIYVALWSLIVGGIVLIAVEMFFLKKPAIAVPGENPENNDLGGEVKNISNAQAFYIGVAQSLAVIPGISRSAATIVSALFFGASRKAAAEFSFLLAVPTVGAAAGYDLLKNIHILNTNDNAMILGVGFIVSFVAALFSIKFMLSYIQRHSFTFTIFGIYRIVIAILFFVYLGFM